MDRKWRALLIVCVAIFMLLLDITIVNVALPKIQSELHASFTDLQWVIDAYALTLATLVLNAGSLADLLGRKRVFATGVALFTLGSALCGSATTPLFLILARGEPGNRRRDDVRHLARDHLDTSSTGGSAAPPSASGARPSAPRWRSGRSSAACSPPGPAGAGSSSSTCRSAPPASRARSSSCTSRATRRTAASTCRGSSRFAGSAFAGVLALLRGNDWGWSSGRVLGLLAAAVVLLIAFAAIQLRAERPTFDLRLFRVPSFTGAQIVAFTISAGMFSQFLYLTLYIQNVLGYSPIGAGLRFLPLSLLSFVVAPIAGRLSVRVPVRYLLGGGLALNGVALLLMHGITPGSGWTTLLPGFIVAGIGIGLVNPPLASTAVGVVPREQGGMASGINNTFRQVGIATGIAALGAIFQDKISSQVPHGLAHAVASGTSRGTGRPRRLHLTG